MESLEVVMVVEIKESDPGVIMVGSHHQGAEERDRRVGRGQTEGHSHRVSMESIFVVAAHRE